MQTYDLVAVDIGKDSLQIQTTSQAFILPNTPQGLRKLLAHLPTLPHPLVVFEASGGYERKLLDALREASIAHRLINPARIRAFALSEGIKAKTDPIDARLILRFAQEKKLQAGAPLSARQQILADLLDRRNHLSEQSGREKNRLEKASKTTAGFIRKMLKAVESQMQAVERAIRLHIGSDSKLASQVREMTSVEGVGEVTAWTVLAYLPEITTIGRNQLVALAGVAPFNRDSGHTQGKRFIFGGRAKLRRVLYMATLSGATHNTVIRDYVHALLARGKAFKSALVAGMRKLLLHLQSRLKQLEQKTLAA